jgi:hypothetical protein
MSRVYRVDWAEIQRLIGCHARGCHPALRSWIFKMRGFAQSSYIRLGR